MKLTDLLEFRRKHNVTSLQTGKTRDEVSSSKSGTITENITPESQKPQRVKSDSEVIYDRYKSEYDELKEEQKKDYPGDVQGWYRDRYADEAYTPDRDPHLEWGAKPAKASR